MDRQCQIPWHQPDLWQLATHSSYLLTCILSHTPVCVVIQPHYVYRLPHVLPHTYVTQSLDPVVQHTQHLKDHITLAKPLSSKPKLIDRLSDPSNQLIHHISHPSKEQT